MDDAGFAGKDKLAPKPRQVQHLISFALNTRQPLAEVVAGQSPELVEWLPQDRGRRRRPTPGASSRPTAWTTTTCSSSGCGCLREFPEQLEHQAGMFRHILIDEMQDTNALQVEIVETIAAAGAGNLTAVGDDAQSIYRFRGANYDNILKFPERHPGSRTLPARGQLPLDARRSSPSPRRRSGTTRSGFPKDARLGPGGRA